MKKFTNDVDQLLHDSLSGFAQAHQDLINVNLEPTFVTRATRTRAGKVAVLSGGGSGHEPLHAGFVGQGMLDAACPGQVFTSPTPDQMMAAAAAVDSGSGVLFIVKNYEGDVMNFEMAAEMAEGDIATVLTNDDVAVEDSTFTTGRRGVAGTVVVEKIVGAAAEDGLDLQALKSLGNRVNKATRSMGVALTSCTVPSAGTPTFEIGGDEIEFGVGIHGEPGRERKKIEQSRVLVGTMMSAISGDLKLSKDDEVLVLVNGFGGTPLMELYVLFNDVAADLAHHGTNISRCLVGNYCTSLDMAGASITLTKLDPEMTRLWDAPVHTAALRW